MLLYCRDVLEWKNIPRVLAEKTCKTNMSEREAERKKEREREGGERERGGELVMHIKLHVIQLLDLILLIYLN